MSYDRTLEEIAEQAERRRVAKFQSDPKWAAEMLGAKTIEGMKFFCNLPDAGPWRITRWGDVHLLASQISGMWMLHEGESDPVKVEAIFQPKEKAMSSHMEEVERRSAALYKAPRVSLDDIKANIVARYDLNAGDMVLPIGVPAHKSLDLLSICLLVTQNGFVVVGKSAPASKENFDREYGKELAYEDAVKQLWPLMGYALRDRLFNQGIVET